MQLRLTAGEKVSYTVLESGAYTVAAEYCAEKDVRARLAADGETVFEGVIAAAEEKAAPEGAEHLLFPGEPAPNELTEFAFGGTKGEHVLTLQVIEGELRLGKIVIRSSGNA